MIDGMRAWGRRGAVLASVLLVLVAALTAHAGKLIWNQEGGPELPLMYALIAVSLSFHGAGQWSLDNALGWGADISGLGWGLGVIAVILVAGLSVVGAARHAARVHALEQAYPGAEQHG